MHVLSMRAAIARRLAAEGGFTLIELMVACTIGIIIILASDLLLDTSITLTGHVSDRVDSAERARLAMAQISRELQSQVCFQDSSGNPQPSILTTPVGLSSPQTGDYAITFYDYIGSTSNPSAYTPQEVTLSWNNSNNTITESDYVGSGTAPNLTFPTTPTKTSTIISNVVPVTNSLNQSMPVFTYYQYSGSTISTTPLSTPLSSSATSNVAEVGVRFVARANERSDAQESTTMNQTVLVPGWDPNTPGSPAPPECL